MRRFLNKTRLLLLILGVLGIVLAGILALLALIQGQSFDQPVWLIVLANLGGGALLLLVRAILNWPKRTRRTTKRKRGSRRKSRRRASSDKDGMVLVLVLVLLGITSVLLFHVQSATRLAQEADLRMWRHARLRAALTDEGFDRARQLANDNDLAVDHLEETWSDIAERDRPDGITTISRVIDLNRYVDLNNLALGADFARQNYTERFLIEAMTMTGDFTPIERIEALTGWMDDEENDIRGSDFYMAKDPPYATPDTWLHTWNELLYIEGFDPEYFERKPLHVVGRPFSENFVELATIVPGPRNQPVPVNINTAPPPVLKSVFGPEEEPMARYIYAARTERPFRSIDALLAQANPELFDELAPFIDVRSTHFLIEVRAFEEGQSAVLRAVVHRESEGQVRILQWQIS